MTAARRDRGRPCAPSTGQPEALTRAPSSRRAIFTKFPRFFAIANKYLRSAEFDGYTSAQLVVTDGGAPTFAQRRFLADVLGGDAARVAIVSDSESVCALVAQMAVFNSGIKAFPPNHYHDVLEHLQIDNLHLPAIEDAVLVLRTMLRLT